MVLANFMADKAVVPAALKHAPDVGLTVIDLIAPAFIFAVGLTYGSSFRRRLAESPGKAVGHFLRRYFALIGIGAIISAGEVAVGENLSGIAWGVLQAIGVAGLLTLPTLLLSPRWRAVVAIVVLAGYQIILDASWLPIVLRSPHGGMHGSLSWSAMMMLSTAIAEDGLQKKVWRLAAWSLAAVAAGLALAAFLPGLVPISKNRVSASYVLLTAGASGLVFAGFRVLVDQWGVRVPLLSAWGKNPLGLYIMHYLLLAFVVLPDFPWWHADSPPLLVAAQALGILAILSIVAWRLDKRGVVLSL